MRNSIGILLVACPIGKDLFQLIDPALDDIGCVPAPRLREFKEPWPRLHIARFVHDDHCEEATSLLIFFGRYLPKKVRQPPRRALEAAMLR